MKCNLITETIDGRTFIGGYYSNPKGIDVPDKIVDAQWRDRFGNYNWELLADGTVVAANLTPTAKQQSDSDDQAFADRVAPIFFKMLRQAIKSTSTPAESWKALDAAIRARLNGG